MYGCGVRGCTALIGVPAWRVHLGMPLCGARTREGSMDAIGELARQDAVRAYLVPFVRQAAGEFPAALAAVREQLPVGNGPIERVPVQSGPARGINGAEVNVG